MTRDDIETAQMVLLDFWEVDEEQQQTALDTAAKCIAIVLRWLEDNE